MRRQREEVAFASGRGALPVVQERKLKLRGELKRLSGDYTRGICGMHYCGWNGGWAFYCACGFCTPLRSTFTEGLDLLESHWQRQGARLAELSRGAA
jgi:hypothetical protein